MKLVKIGHCGGYEMSRKEVLEMLNDSAPVKPMIVKSPGKKFLVLQGNTRIAGYIWVIQSIANKYKPSDVVAVAENLSVWSIA